MKIINTGDTSGTESSGAGGGCPCRRYTTKPGVTADINPPPIDPVE